MRLICLLLFFCLAITATFAQEYAYTRFDVQEGLAGSNVYAATQDPQGFIWFATETGLSRFDGRHFTTFTTKDGLPDNEIINILADSKGRVWILPFRKSVCYFYKGRLHTSANDSLLRQFELLSNILLVEEDKQGNLLFLEVRKIHLLNADNKLRSFTQVEGRNAFTAASKSPSGFYLTVNDRLYELANGRFYRRGDRMAAAAVLNTAIIQGKVFVRNPYPFTGQTRIAERDGTTRPFNSYREHISFSNLNDSLFTDNGHDGVYLYHIDQSKKPVHLLPGKSVSRTFRDRDGNTWFCTQREGVYLLHPQFIGNLLLKDPGGRNLSVHSLIKHQGILLAGTNMSYLLQVENGVTKSSKRVGFTGEEDAKVRVLAPCGNRVVYGTQSAVGWVGSAMSKEIPALKDIMVLDSQLLVAAYQGVYMLNRNDLNKVDTIWRERATTAFYRNDSFFIGTLEGLYIITNKANTAGIRIDHSLQSRIAAIRESPDGSLWIATYDRGILVFINGKIVETITTQQGLTSDICKTMFIHRQYAWVGTDKGLNRISIAKPHSIHKYTLTDGLSSNFINTVYVDDSAVYAGTPAGISWFGHQDRERVVPCRLEMTGIHNGKRKELTDELKVDRRYPLVFEYAGISYDCCNELFYRYRLSGLDSGWDTTKMNSLHYAALQPGDYVLELQAVNYYGSTSHIVTVPFTVARFWWEHQAVQIPGILLLAIVAILGTRFVIRLLQKKEKQKANIKKQLAELEQKALKSQMNPHFIFNSLNSIQNYVVNSDLVGGNQYITAFARLIRLTLEYSDKMEISVVEEAEYLDQYLRLEKMRMNHRFDFAINVAHSLRNPYCRIPPMLLQPLVENSLRHGIRYAAGQGMITVNIENEKNGVRYTVEDNGAGIAATHQGLAENSGHHSRGLHLLRQRIDAMNCQRKHKITMDIADLGKDGGRGTRISLFFPFNDL